MVNVSRVKNEYGHHLLNLSLCSVCVYGNHAQTHNVLLERDLEIWKRKRGGRRQEQMKRQDKKNNGDKRNI